MHDIITQPFAKPRSKIDFHETDIGRKVFTKECDKEALLESIDDDQSNFNPDEFSATLFQSLQWPSFSIFQRWDPYMINHQ